MMRTASTDVIRLQPTRGWVALDLAALWTYRELLYFLVWRDVKIRYKQTVLGAAWAILQPLLTMILFSVVFGRLAGIPSDDVPYPIFTYCALLPWHLFAYSLTNSSASLVANQPLITKIYFPRLIIPLAAVLAGLVDFAIAFVVLIGMLLYFQIVPGAALIAFPLFIILAAVSALAVGLWLSALNVQFRDVKYTVPFLTQLWMFATPIAYPSSLIPEAWRLLYSLNPMAGVVEGFRWALLGTQTLSIPALLVSSLTAVLALIGGAYYFVRMERTFADVI